MLLSPMRCLRGFAVCALMVSGVFSAQLYAQTHVVSSADLHKEVVAASDARQQHVDQVMKFLSSEQAKKALSAAGVESSKVTSAIPTLSDQELADLSARASKAQADFAAGTLSDHDLTLIILAIAILVLLIVAIRH